MINRLCAFGLSLAALTGAATTASAMTATPVKLTLWTRGEALNADDLLPANEAVVDYLGTLARPSDPLDDKGLRYNCLAKARPFTTTAVPVGSTMTSTVEFQMVYELSSCAPAT